MPNHEIDLQSSIWARVNAPIPLDPNYYLDSGEGDLRPTLYVGDSGFDGDCLEGFWKKGNDGSIVTPVSKLDGSGKLVMSGASDAGSARYHWIRSEHPIFMMEGLELEVVLEVPTSVSSGKAVFNQFYVFESASTLPGSPDSEFNGFGLSLRNNNGVLEFNLSKEVDGSWTTVIDWGEYALTNENVAFKFVFHLSEGHVHFYYDDGESETWVEPPAESPANLGLLTYAFPNFRMRTDDTTDRTIKSDSLRVTYPRGFRALYDMALSSLHYGHVTVFEDVAGTPDLQVYDETHKFTPGNGFYIQNDFVRLYVALAYEYGLGFFFWDNTGVTYRQPNDAVGFKFTNLAAGAIALNYPFFKHFTHFSREKVVAVFRMQDSAVDDEDYYLDLEVTLERGKRYFLFKVLKVYPVDEFWVWCWDNSSFPRFGYVGGQTYPQKCVADNTLSEAFNYTDLKDNFGIQFDPDVATKKCLCGMAFKTKPDGTLKRFQNYEAGFYYQDANPNQLPFEFIYYMVEFLTVADLHFEAEDGAIGGSASVDNSLGDDSGDSVKLIAQWDYVHEWMSDALAKLPKGKYLFAARIKDLNQIASEVQMSVWNNSDLRYLNEEMDWITFAVTGSFLWYGVLFDMTDEEDGDAVYFRIRKATATSNSVWVDEWIYLPMSDGINMPLDLAHNFLRHHGQKFKVIPK